MEKTHPISTLERDQTVHDIYAVKQKRSPIAYNKGWRFELTLTDATGQIFLKYWGGPNEQEVKAVYDAIKEGGVIHVQARVNEYMGKLELSTDETMELRVLKPNEYKAEQFIAVSKRDIEEMWREFDGHIKSIKDPTIRKVLDDIFGDKEFVARFKHAPAAMHTHHAWLGGLMEHTLSIISVCNAAVKSYPELNRDLVVAGALLHDLGKLEEYEVSTVIKTTPVGMLIGHLSLQVGKIMEYRGKPGIDENTLLKLAHMVISHHGKHEFGSPKIPAFPEALLFSTLDALDAQMERMLRIMHEANTESFEVYDKKEGRDIYLR